MNSRETLNNPISNNSLKINVSSDIRNFKTTYSNGGSYSSSGASGVVTLYHTPKYVGSTVVAQWQGNGHITWAGYNYYCYFLRNGVVAPGSQSYPIKNTGPAGTYDLGHFGLGATYYYANSANLVQIGYSIEVVSSGNGSYPMYWGVGSISVWEQLP